MFRPLSKDWFSCVDKVSELEPKALAESLIYKMRPGMSVTEGSNRNPDLFRESIREIPVAVLNDMPYLNCVLVFLLNAGRYASSIQTM